MPRFPRLAAGSTCLAAAAAVALIAPASAGAVTAAHHHRPALTVRVHGRTVRVPEQEQPGLVHLRSRSLRSVVVFRPRRHGDAAGLAHDLGHLHSVKAVRRLLRQFDEVGFVARHRDTYTQLRRGSYLFVEPRGHLRATDIAVTTVTGPRRDAVAPPAAPVSLDAGHRIHVHQNVSAGLHWLRAHNSTRSTQAAVVLRIPSSVSDATVHRFVQHPTYASYQQVVPNFDLAALALMPSRSTTYSRVHLRPGRYLAMVKLKQGQVAEMVAH